MLRYILVKKHIFFVKTDNFDKLVLSKYFLISKKLTQ